MDIVSSIKQDILDSLYTVCKDPTLTTVQVVDKFICKLGNFGTGESLDKDRLIEIVRPYRFSGKGLEQTVFEIYNLLYPYQYDTASLKKSIDEINSIYAVSQNQINQINLPPALSLQINHVSKRAAFVVGNSIVQVQDHLEPSKYPVDPTAVPFPNQGCFVDTFLTIDPDCVFLLQKDDSLICFSKIFGIKIVPK